MDKPEYHVVSFSGGKDSTAMLLGMMAYLSALPYTTASSAPPIRTL